MQDPVEKLKETETFQKLDRKVEWSQAVLFGTVILLVVVAVGKQVA
jgi:tetrahydromethanopterin S-methyltransferase subunit G